MRGWWRVAFVHRAPTPRHQPDSGSSVLLAGCRSPVAGYRLPVLPGDSRRSRSIRASPRLTAAPWRGGCMSSEWGKGRVLPPLLSHWTSSCECLSPRFICPLDHTCCSDAVWATSTCGRGVGSWGGGGDDRSVQDSGSCRGGGTTWTSWTSWTSGSRGPVGAEPRLTGQVLHPLLDKECAEMRWAHPRLGAHPGQHVPASTPHRCSAGAPSRRVAPRPVVRPKSAIAGRWVGKSPARTPARDGESAGRLRDSCALRSVLSPGAPTDLEPRRSLRNLLASGDILFAGWTLIILV